MAGPSYVYNNEYVIQNIGDLKNNYDEYASGSATVTVSNHVFSPLTASIEIGDTIIWSFQSTHAVRSGVYDTHGSDGDGQFESGIKANTQTYSLTFNVSGSYDYFCAIHPATMAGRIEVSNRRSSESNGYVPVSKVIPGPSSLRGRSSAYTPSMGGNPLDMGK